RVHEGQLAEDAALLDGLEHRVADPQLDDAGADDEHLAARVAGLEDDLAGVHLERRLVELHQRFEIALDPAHAHLRYGSGILLDRAASRQLAAGLTSLELMSSVSMKPFVPL